MKGNSITEPASAIRNRCTPCTGNLARRLQRKPGDHEIHCVQRFFSRFSVCLLVILGPVMLGCAGYNVGNQTLYRTDMRTIHVPIFYSNSLRPYLGQWITEAVVKEIELRTPYKVVHDPMADSILTGRLTHDIKRVQSENVNDEPRRLLYTPMVTVTWIDRQGQILMNSTFNLSADLVPESGQSITAAQFVTIQQLASQIVSEMEAHNW